MTREMTLERAKEIAIEKEHAIVAISIDEKNGNLCFYVTSASHPYPATHKVTKKIIGYACDEKCDGFKYNGTCAHIGCVNIYMKKNYKTVEERATFLQAKRSEAQATKKTAEVKKLAPIEGFDLPDGSYQISTDHIIPAWMMGKGKGGQFSHKKGQKIA